MTTAQKVLELLKSGMRTQADLARTTGRSKKAISRDLQQLIKTGKARGIGTTTNRYFEAIEGGGKMVDSKGRQLVDSPTEAHTITDHATSSHAQAQSQDYRNHATYLELPLEHYDKEGLARLCADKGLNFKQWALRNSYPLIVFQDGYELRIYNRSVIIVPPDAAASQQEAVPFALTQEVLRGAWDMAQQLKAPLGLKYGQIGGFCVGALVRQELAQTNNELAKNILEKPELKAGARTFRIIDPDTNRKCFEFDDSPPDSPAEWYRSLKEAEATDPANADNHATAMHVMIDDVLHRGAWEKATEDHAKLRLVVGSLEQMVPAINILQGEVAEFHVWLAHHDQQIQASTRLTEELREQMKPGLLRRILHKLW